MQNKTSDYTEEKMTENGLRPKIIDKENSAFELIVFINTKTIKIT